MGSVFIYTGGGYVNLATITNVRNLKNGRFILYQGDIEVDDNNVSFGDTIASLLASQGWECLELVYDTDMANPVAFSSQPILAFGLTPTGELRPITPGEMNGVSGNYALRQIGTEPVYEYGCVEPFSNADAWLKSKQQSASQVAAE